MKSVKTEFPNPVLASGRDDYIDSCQFGTTFEETEISVTADDIVIPINYNLVCKGLQDLVEREQAVAVVSVKSSASSYSRLFRFPKDSKTMELRIPKYSVVKRIEIAGAIIAATAIPGFRCEGEFNELYFGSSAFEIRKGDILAREDSRIIYVDDSELEKPIASIFNINKMPEQADDVVAEFDGEKIEINLKEELYGLYYKFKEFNNGALRRYITGIIVYPVLVEAISKICEHYQNGGDDGRDELRWFRAIERKAEKIGISFDGYEDSYSTVADKLLGNIALDALKSFKDMLESEMNSGETHMIGGQD